jgi:hypothetical protein
MRNRIKAAAVPVVIVAAIAGGAGSSHWGC